MSQYKVKLGNSTVLTQASQVTNQYGPGGLAQGDFASVFDTPEDPSDSQLRIYTMMTSIGNFTLPDDEDAHLAILGRIEYGIGGASFACDFDWKMGTQFTVAASFVRLLAAFSEVGDLAPSEVRVAGMFSSGSRAARSQVTRSYPQLEIHDGGNSTVLIPVPPMAHALNIFSAEPEFYEAGNAKIRYVAGANNGPSAPSTSLAVFQSDGVPFLAGLSNEDGVRFPECARFVEISYESEEEGTYHITPCFTLSL